MISLHIVVDNATTEQLDMAVWYLVELNKLFPDYPHVVNIAAGSQIDRGQQFVERVRAALSDITIIWRILEDTGIHKEMNVSTWWNSRVRPYLAWMKKNRVVMLLDNESSGDDAGIRYYVQWHIAALKLLHAEGLYGAVLRFASGNIHDGHEAPEQYSLLKPLFQHLLPGDLVSPNEYTNLPGRSSAGHLGRWKLIEAAAGHQLHMTIGEAGLLEDYKARDGWVDKTTEEAYVAAVLDDEQWYRPEIVRCLFCIGGYQEWDTLQVNRKILELLLAHYREVKPAMNKPIIITIKSSGTRIRETPSANGKIVTTFEPGQLVATQTGEELKSGQYTWLPVRIGSVERTAIVGYIAKEVIEVSDVPEVPNPTTVTIDEMIFDDAKTLVQEMVEDAESLAAKGRAILEKMQTAR